MQYFRATRHKIIKETQMSNAFIRAPSAAPTDTFEVMVIFLNLIVSNMPTYFIRNILIMIYFLF